jgi:hypothetical protein
MKRTLVKPTLIGLAAVALVACASGQTATRHTTAVESHVYALPLDDVLTETTTLLTRRGWRVERSGDSLGTNWRLDASGAALGYRVEGERLDAEHCSIRIESLAATSFAPPPERGSGSAAPAGAATTAWEGVDAPTTLGEPPPGMVVLPRGRDEGLEWALLQVLDPRAAQAIEHADARSVAARPGDAGVAPTASGCAPPELSGVGRLLSERRLVLLADVSGTNEIPDFVGRLACQAARAGAPTVVALELLRVDQDWVDTYLASQGSPADRAAFLQVTRSFDPRLTGAEASDAVLLLLDRLRGLRDAGLPIRVVAFAEAANVPSRAKSEATTLERFRRTEPDAFMVVLTERSQARTALAPPETEGQGPLGFYLLHWGLEPVALDVHSPGGQVWACAASRCGPLPAAAPAAPPPATGPTQSVALYASPDAQGFLGAYNVGAFTPTSLPKP